MGIFLRDGRRTVGGLSGVLAFLFVPLLAAPLLAAVAPAARAAGPPPAPKLHPVTGLAAVLYRPVRVSGQTSRKFTPTATRWPAAASAAVTVAAPAAGARAGRVTAAAGTPAWVQPVAPRRGRWLGPSQLGVDVQAQPVSRALGIAGVVWEVSGLSAGAGGMRAGLSYKAFAQAYGGNYGSRLRLVELPACALTTPQLAACRKQTPLPTVNDYHAATVSTVLPLPASPSVPLSPAGTAPAGPSAAVIASAVPASTAMVLAATTSAVGEGGAAGTYAATPLKPSGSWAEGGDSGSFTYSYPIAVPRASSDLVPGADLSYDSGSVDGQTASTQAQAAWAGRRLVNRGLVHRAVLHRVRRQPGRGTLPAADQTGDMCYDGQILTMSLDGSSTALVRDDSTGTWRLSPTKGRRITHVTGSGNGTGTYNTDYWMITKRDGTKYYFGLQPPARLGVRERGYQLGGLDAGVLGPLRGPVLQLLRVHLLGVHDGLPVAPGLRHRRPRRRDGLLLQPGHQLLRRGQRRHERLLHPRLLPRPTSTTGSPTATPTARCRTRCCSAPGPLRRRLLPGAVDVELGTSGTAYPDVPST